MASFSKATKKKAKLRLALIGPTGSGKTYTGLSIASHLGSKIAVIDTEHGSASKYADLFGFEVAELSDFSPTSYIQMLHEAAQGGFDVVMVDSLTHAWVGKGGVLDIKDRATKGGNSFNAWAVATPEQNKLVEALLSCPMHLIVTLRSKMEYVPEKDPNTGKTSIKKIGLQPVQRDGVEYEFDVIGDLDQENVLSVTKTRCPALAQTTHPRAGKMFADTLRSWLECGVTPEPEKPKFAAPDHPAGGTKTGKKLRVPQTGVELLKHLAGWDKFLADNKLAGAGALLVHINKAFGPKYGDNVEKWTADICQAAFDEARQFETDCRSQWEARQQEESGTAA